MNTFSKPPPGQGLQHLESFKFPSTASLPSTQSQDFCSPGALSHAKPEIIAEPTSPTPLTSQLTTFSLKAPLCLLCKGQKYGFTAYFHNPKIFPEPPHELLPLIEESYVLKNRLESLLVTYIMRGLEPGGVQEAKNEASVWSQLVKDLLSEVVASAVGFELDLRPLEEVRKWTREMTRQIRDSLVGRQKLEMPKGRLLILLLEYRKLWEGVWKKWLLDRKSGSSMQDKVQD